MKTQAHQWLTLLAGWMLVLAFGCSLPGLVPGAFAALARLEGSHGVEIGTWGGETRVVLTHHVPAGVRSHEAIHHHCQLARMLAAFAEAPRGDGPDHLVKFTSSANRSADKRAVTPAAPLTAEAAAPEFFVVAELAIPRLGDLQEWPEGAPPRPPDGLLELKSTRLLI